MAGVVDVASGRDRQAEAVLPVNIAAWMTDKQGTIAVGPAPYTRPRANEIVVRNRAVSINPIDWITQAMGDIIFPFLPRPFVLGWDVAGEVVEVGSAVTRFKVGDRVVGNAVGGDKQRNSAAEGGFQTYTVLLDHMASPIPADMAYEAAAILPLALSTAACGLFEKDQLGLSYPTHDPVSTGKTLLVWGGSTSVGANAIQLAVAAGYEVIATASPKNFGYVKSLGASAVFDYRSGTVVRDIIAAFEGRVCAGALAIGAGSGAPCLEIVGATRGDKVVAMASTPVLFEKVPEGLARGFWLVPAFARMAAGFARLALLARRRGIRTSNVFGSTLLANEVGPLIYVEFLPQALASGQFLPAPQPLVIGHGLDAIAAGLAQQRRGVSARKLVVTL